MKRLWTISSALFVMLVMMIPISTHAQLDIDVGGTGTCINTGGTGYTGVTPYSRWYSGWRTQYIIPASELAAAGMPPGQIVALSFNVCTVRGDAIPAFTIRMANVNFSSFTSTTYTTGTTTVFGPQDIGIPTTGWNKHQFHTPFLWDGTSNLLVEVCSQIPSGSCGTCCGYTLNCDVFMTTVSYNTTLYYYTDGNCNTCTQASGYGYYTIRPVMRFSVLSGIEQSFPDDVDPRRILRTDGDYDGSSSQYPKPSLTFRVPSGQTVQLKYKIVGPLPSTNVVYRALNSANVNDTVITVSGVSGLVTRTFNFSTGPLGGGSGQIGNGTLRTTLAVGGSYRVEAEYRLPSINYTQQWNKQFIIAYSNDIALADIVAPRRPPFKYLRGVNVPIAVRVQNVGLNPATNFRVIAQIKQNGVVVKGPDTVVYNQTPGLATGQTYTANFPYFNSLVAGTFTFETWVELLNGNDQNTANNMIASVLPPGVSEWTFEVQYDTEVEALAILKPTSSSNDVYVNRPYNVAARFRNNGAADQSDVPTTLTIERWNGSSWDLVFQTTAIVSDISATPPNTTDMVYAPWTPQQTGLHRVCVTISAPGDPVNSNDTKCETFTVGDGLSGTFTIGTANAGNPRNFTTIEEAVNALYSRGVSGPVTFELTDASYTVGSLSGPPQPALDLSAKILGVSATNTITFKPSLMRSLTRGSVVIRLQSQAGIGVYIAQNTNPSNPNAIQNSFKNSQFYANPTPYIRFDGGDQKSLRLLLDVGNATPQQLPHRAVFYLGTGASNVTIRNCLLENWPQSSASYAGDLPVVRYIAPNFTFEADVRQLQQGPSS
ncbi:MAG: hypothetical protein N2663_00105, partial [Chlorobi bacterium]|nr:hypothetical protein [Chlorobiota bacterium]